MKRQSEAAVLGRRSDDLLAKYETVSATAEVIRAFHGGRAEIKRFDKAHIGSNTGKGWLGDGFYFSPHEDAARSYGPVITTVDVHLKNPYRFPEGENPIRWVKDHGGGEEFTQWVKEQGYDGIISEALLHQIVAFEPSQIHVVGSALAATSISATDAPQKHPFDVINEAKPGQSVLPELKRLIRVPGVKISKSIAKDVFHAHNAVIADLTEAQKKAGHDSWGTDFSQTPHINVDVRKRKLQIRIRKLKDGRIRIDDAVFNPVEVIKAEVARRASLEAKIQHPPRALKQSLKLMVTRLQGVKSFVEDIIKIAPTEKYEAEDFYDKLVLDEDDLKWIIKSLDKSLEALKNIDDCFSIYNRPGDGPHLTETIHTWLTVAQEGAARLYQASSIRRLEDKRQDRLENLEWDVEHGNITKESAAVIERALHELPELLRGIDFTPLIKGVKEQQRLQEVSYGIGGDEDKLRPPSEDVEVLYHASVNAGLIFKSGFEKIPPVEGGIGGSQSDKKGTPSVSFTSDLYVAKEIARTFKEVAGFLRGDFKIDSLLEAMDDEGIKDDVLKNMRVNYKHERPTNDVEMFELYRTYLALSKKRYDPVFFGSPEKFVRAFKNADPSKIGIVAARIDMKNPDIMYLHAMREYRVPVDAVLSVEKLIR